MEFLQRVYDAAQGTESAVAHRPIAEAIGLNDGAHLPFIRYLKGEGLLDQIAVGFVKLTHAGIVAVEELRQGKAAHLAGSLVLPQINIGTLNVTGTANLGQIVGNIEQHITQISNSGNTSIAATLQEFTRAVVDDKGLDQRASKEVLEYLETIAEEADKEPVKRKSNLVKTILASVPVAIQTSAALVDLWNKFSGSFFAFFCLPQP